MKINPHILSLALASAALALPGVLPLAATAAPTARVQVAQGNVKDAVLNVKGMYCSGCVSGLEGMLEKVQGVAKAKINLDAGTASVRYDATKVSVASLRAAIEKAGFKVTKITTKKVA